MTATWGGHLVLNTGNFSFCFCFQSLFRGRFAPPFFKASICRVVCSRVGRGWRGVLFSFFFFFFSSLYRPGSFALASLLLLLRFDPFDPLYARNRRRSLHGMSWQRTSDMFGRGYWMIEKPRGACGSSARSHMFLFVGRTSIVHYTPFLVLTFIVILFVQCHDDASMSKCDECGGTV